MNIDEAIELLECSAVAICDTCSENKIYRGNCEKQIYFNDALSMAIESLKIRKRNDQLFQSIKKLVEDQAIEYKKGYKQALEEYKKFSYDYSSCDHHCNENSSCIDCFIERCNGYSV